MVHCRIKLDEFWVKIAKFVPQTRRNLLLAKFPKMNFANSETPLPMPTSFWLVGLSWGL